MSKPIIALKTHARDYDGLAMLGSAVHEALSGNFYFPSPSPALPVIKNAVDQLAQAIGTWGPKGNRGSHADLVDLRLKARTLMALLRCEAWFVESTASQIAGSDYILAEQIINSSGFAMRNRNSPQGVLEKVQNIHRVVSRTLNQNEVMLQWQKPLSLNSLHNVKMYLVFRGTTPVFSEAICIADRTSTTFLDVNETGEMQTWFYWVAPLNYAGMGVLSEMVKVKVLWK